MQQIKTYSNTCFWLIFFVLVILIKSPAQNVLNNPNFDQFPQKYAVPAHETPLTNVNAYNYPINFGITAPTIFNGPIFPGQVWGDQYTFVHDEGSSTAYYTLNEGVSHWNNPAEWIYLDLNNPQCVIYGPPPVVGYPNPDGKNNFWSLIYNFGSPGSPEVHVKSHAADWYKWAPLTGRVFPDNAPSYNYPTPSGAEFIHPLGHQPRSGQNCIGMRTNSLIQELLPIDLQPGALYRFTCYIKPVRNLLMNYYATPTVNYDAVYQWDRPADLKVLLSFRPMTYQASNCNWACEDLRYKEKQCGDQLITEYDLATITPNPGEYYNEWIPLTGYLTAPGYATYCDWIGVELQGNCESYILIDDLSLEPVSSVSCETNITIQNQTLEDWANNKRSSDTYINIGPNVIVPPLNNSEMIAEKKIELKPGFYAQSGSVFLAKIDDCSNYLGFYHPLHPKIDVCNDVNNRFASQKHTENIMAYAIFPNPSTGHFVFSKENDLPVLLEIFDASGRLIFRSESVTENKLDIDLSKESNGIYFVHLVTESDSRTFRIIKE